jgi:threonine dehydratase
MNQIPLEKLKEARERLGKIFPETPTIFSDFYSSKTGLQVHLKMENLNVSGSFKVRGATNAILEAGPLTKDGVVATSAGNHAQGVAIAARMQGIKATIFMPERAPIVKVESTKNYGAQVILTGDTYDDAEIAAEAWQAKHGGLMIHPFADEAVIAGQGTVALELLDQVENLDAILVPVGGGGLVSGIASAVKQINPNIKIIGLQTELYPTMYESFRDRKISSPPKNPEASIADGIAVKGIRKLNFDIICKNVDEMHLVSESQIAGSIMELMERNHLLAEGAGAIPVAALDDLALSLKAWKKNCRVACIIAGGNIDVTLLSRITNRGLIRNGRLLRLKVVLRDRPGAMAKLLDIIYHTGANLYNLEHNRMAKSGSIYTVEVLLELETINMAHQEKIQDTILNNGYAFSAI